MITKNIQMCFVIIAVISSWCCAEQKAKVPVVIPKDTTVTDENSFSRLSLDSTKLEDFITQAVMPDSVAAFMRNFYNARNFHFAWFTEEGITDPALAFWNLHNNFINYSRDSSILDKALHQMMNSVINEDTSLSVNGGITEQLELQLTEHFYEYAHYAYRGRVDPWELQWHIPAKKVDVLALLDTIIAHEGKNLDELEPLNAAYKLLKNELLRYYEIEEKESWTELIMPGKRIKVGDSGQIISKIKQRLLATRDYMPADTSASFNKALEDAVKRAQKRFGLTQDGIIKIDLIRELNGPIKDRIAQMLINMERMRWLPKEPAGNRIVVNIPAFKLYVFEEGKPVFNIDIVVGKEANRTVVFTDELKYVVFSPYWNVPRSIVRNEILPAMKRDARYLIKHNMEQTGMSNGLPVIRQKPGKSNALGRVKFIFPNNYSIYFHDTPARSLFKRQKRALSHGCIRLAEPQKLAGYLLRNHPGWPSNKIREAMYAGKEKWVALDEPVPVALLYFTAWVDSDGLLNFREDIYGHDKRMAKRLFD